MRFDVVVGNPPYTHLRNMNNRKYAKYPRQRDMAQVFVRWALDNITEKGVISYNISDRWIDVKISDGALETRKLIGGYGVHIEDAESIRRYSESDGGDICTIILGISKNGNDLIYNGQNIDVQLDMSGFLTSLRFGNKTDFVSVGVQLYAKELSGVRGQCRTGKSNKWQNNVFLDYGDDGDFYIMSKRHISYTIDNSYESYRGQFKLVRINDVLDASCDLESEVKYAKVGEFALAIFGFMNTKTAFKLLPTYTKPLSNHGGTFAQSITNNMWPLLRVPDFDYYKENHPEQFNNYMKWVEDNMVDKDKFLAGIDEQFELLIS